MASLFWRNIPRTTPHLGSLKLAIAGKLRDHGFENVEIGDADIKASKAGTFTAIAHLKIGNQRFWEMAMTSGDTLAVTRPINVEVQRILLDEIHIID